MSQKTILFVCYGGGHVRMLIPVIQQLRRECDYELIVLGLTTARSALTAAGIDSMGFADFVDPITDEKALQFGSELTRDLPTGSVSREESIAYHGISFAELVEDLGEEEARKSYDRLGRHSFCPVGFLQRVMKQAKPDLLVSTNSPRSEKAAFLAAREMGIPSLCLIDLFGLQELKRIKSPGYASKFCVLTDVVKESFIASGIPSENVLVTGNPAFDRLSDPELQEKGKRLRENRGWFDKKVLLWASQPEPAIHAVTEEIGDPKLPRKIDRELEKFGRSHPDWQLVIRLHPNESTREMSDLWAISSQDESLDELLATCSLVLVMSSTVGLEAALLGIPVLQFTGSVTGKHAQYYKMGLAKAVESISILESSLIDVMENRWEPSPVICKVGGATKRIIESIDAELHHGG